MKHLFFTILLTLSVSGFSQARFQKTPKIEYVKMTSQEWETIDTAIPIFVKTIYQPTEMVVNEYRKPTFFRRAKCVIYFKDIRDIIYGETVINVQKVTYRYKRKELINP